MRRQRASMAKHGNPDHAMGRRAMLALAVAGPLTAMATGTRAADDASDGLRFVCTTPDCAPYIYDPAIGNPSQGVPPGTPFEALPDTWRCPSCGSAHDAFIPIG